MPSAHDLAGGFSDHAFDSQAVFRSVLGAMARPGAAQPLQVFTRPPAPCNPAAAAVLLALADADTPVFLDAPLAAAPAVAAWIRFHSGAPLTSRADEAAFAVISGPDFMPPLDSFAQGTAEYPDRSATLILQVEALADGPEAIELRGPGIAEMQLLAATGLPARFPEMWAANRAIFPLGVDVILAAPTAVAALPRTVAAVRPAEARPIEGQT